MDCSQGASYAAEHAVAGQDLANDTDADSDALVLLGWTQPSHGRVAVDTRGTPHDPTDDFFLYRPEAGYSGSDSFSYTVSDGRGGTGTVSVSLTVAALNDAPYAGVEWTAATFETALNVYVLDNDGDWEDDVLSISSAGTPLHGTATIHDNGTSGDTSDDYIVYTPANGYAGPDYFAYTINDGNGGTAIGRVYLQVYGPGQWAQSVAAISSEGEDWGLGSEALGAPDTFFAGDGSTAWLATGGGQYEFITVSFENAAYATGVMIRGSNGGAVVRGVQLIEDGGAISTIWKGTNPSPASGLVDFYVSFPATVAQIKSVRVFVDGSQGSAQIDAVRLLTGGTAASVTLSAWAYEDSGTATYTLYNAEGLADTQEVYGKGALVQTREFEYTLAGKLSEATLTNAVGQATNTTYDGEGRVLTETLAYGTAGAATTTYDYDLDGDLVSLIDAVGNETTWTHDGAGRVLTMTDPLLNSETKTYDSEGRLASILSRNGLLRTFDYDVEGRLETETWYDGATELDPVVQTFTWTYNAKGQVATASKTDGTVTFTYTYTYNSAGQIATVEVPLGVSLAFGYDQYGNRNLVIDSLGGEERSTYDDRGLLVRHILTQGSTVLRIDQTYDVHGRVLTQSRYSDAPGTTLIADTEFTYHEDGRISGITHDPAVGSDIEYDYVFDAAGQLTQWTDHGVTHTYDYDGQGQLISDDYGTTDIDYAYDANGNRTAHTYNSSYTNQLAGDGVWTYTHDANGNMTGKDEVAGDDSWSYHYDHANQLIRVEEYDGPSSLLNVVLFKYDAYGNRVEKVVNPALVGPAQLLQRYAYDGWNTSKPTPIGNENWDVFADLHDNGSLATRYLRGDVVDQLFAHYDGTDAYWLLTDHLGSIRDVVDDTGTVVTSVTYDVFGNVLSESGTGELGRYAWTGRERDVEIDLQYNRARYYDPTTGRWISEDPIRFAAGDGNLYRYVNNRFVIVTDPSGLQAPANAHNTAEYWKQMARKRIDISPILSAAEQKKNPMLAGRIANARRNAAYAELATRSPRYSFVRLGRSVGLCIFGSWGRNAATDGGI